MDFIKIWGNLLAASGACILPPTYFRQGVHLFALDSRNALLQSSSSASASSSSSTSSESISGDELESNNLHDDNGIQDEIEDNSDEEDLISNYDTEKQEPGTTKNARKRRIQRTRYSREEYKCATCAYTCTTERAFLKHLRCDCDDVRSGGGEPRLSCPICGKDRDSEQLIIAHMNKHRDGKQFCCDLCKFRTLQLKKLIQHRRMHTGEKPHLCPYCSYRSARRDNLRSHVRRVHKKENLTGDTFTPRSMVLTPRIPAAPN